MNNNFIFFWKDADIYSQWNKNSFWVSGQFFKTAEHWMMFHKALFFNDLETAQLVLDSKHPRDAKELGKKVKGFNDTKWDTVKEKIVYAGSYFKFEFNIELVKQLLLTTGTLVEASPFDTIWGIGLSEEDPLAQDQKTWKGKNLLGKILTKLREDYKAKTLDIKTICFYEDEVKRFLLLKLQLNQKSHTSLPKSKSKKQQI